MTRQRKTPDLLSELLAGSETEEGFKEKLRGCSKAKARTNAVADHMVIHEPLLFKESELLHACSTWLVFRHFYTAGKYRLIGGCTCKKHLICAMCAWRRSAKTVMAYSAKIKMVMNENPNLIPVLITMTVKNGPSLAERFAHNETCYSKMVKSRSRAANGGRHTTVFRQIHGAAGAFEFKRGKNSGLWHPHLHMIALVDQGTDLLAMSWDTSQEWRELTEDSSIIDIRPIDMSNEKSRMGAICEVFRYALKFGEMSIEDQVHAYKVLKSKKLLRNFGSLRCQVPDELHDTVEDELKLQPYIDLVYEYSKKKGFFLSDVTDTEDSLTHALVRPKRSEGQKMAPRLSSKLFVSIPDPDSPRKKKISLDFDYVKKWVQENPAQDTFKPEEVPF